MTHQQKYIDKELGYPLVDPFQQILDKMEDLSIQIAALNEYIAGEIEEAKHELIREKHS